MPNIREVSAPADTGLRPDDRAQESLANSGRRISQLYGTAAEATNSVGRSAAGAINAGGEQAVRYLDNREISAGASKFADLMAGLDTEWNKTVKTADPNDPAVAEKFLNEVVNPRLEKMKDGFNTENSNKFAESQIQHLRTHFLQKTSADMSTLAGVAAKTNINNLTNQLSNAAMADPSSLSTSLKMVEASVGAMVDSSPTMRGVDAGRAKIELTDAAQTAIVKAAAIGAIAANPEKGLEQFSKPEYAKYISGAELKQLEQQAKTVERARRVDENYQLQNQKLFKQEASDNREGEYLQKLHSDDPKDRSSVSAAAIANDFTLTREARERMINIVERENKPAAAAKVSNDTANDLISRIRLPEGDPRRITDLNEIYNKLEKGTLNKSDFKFVIDEFKNIRTPDGMELGQQQNEFIKSVKPMIDKSNLLMGKIDQSGAMQMYAFTLALQKKVDEYRKSGKDPRDLMDPSKPDFMGSPAALSQFQKPLQQSMQDVAASLRTGATVPVSGAPAAPAAPSATNPPLSLRGIATLNYSASRQQYRDEATGDTYDLEGKKVK